MLRSQVLSSLSDSGKSVPSQTDIRSPKTGLKFYTEDGKQCSFFADGKVIEMWVVQLGKKLHQKGFHERFKPFRKLGKGNFATVY